MRRVVRRTTLICLWCATFLVGLWVTGVGWQVSGWPWLVVAVCLLVLCGRKQLVVAVPAVLCAGLLCGLWRGSEVQLALGGYGQFIGQKVAVQGTIVEDPTYNDKGQQDLRLTNVRVGDRGLPGVVRVTTYSLLDVKRGDVVRAEGKLYDGFGNYRGAMYYANLDLVSVNTSWIEEMRRQFAASIYTHLPEPQASLGLGFLVGIRSQLPDELDEQLRVVGLTHIVVASGYNLTILVRLARRLFEKRSKYQTALAGTALMATFVGVSGLSPSMSRAALVTGLSLLVWYFGRRMHPVLVLLLSAAITAGINPLYIWGDLGWWLSFLAFAGVMLVAPLLQKRIFGEREPKFLGQLMVETTSAQLVTLPLIVTMFGVVPLLSLPANVLVVPLVPLAMLLTFIAGTLGYIAAIAPLVALPATWLLGYMTELVAWLAAVPWASWQVSVDAVAMLAMYGAMLVIGIIAWRVTKHDYLSKSVIE